MVREAARSAQRDEDIKWYMVVNEDEAREFPDDPESKLALTASTEPNEAGSRCITPSICTSKKVFEDIDRVKASGGMERRLFPVSRRGPSAGPAVPEGSAHARGKKSTDTEWYSTQDTEQRRVEASIHRREE